MGRQHDLPLGRWGIILSCQLGFKGSLALSTGHLGVWIKYHRSLSPVLKSSHFGHSWRFIRKQIIEGITLFSSGIRLSLVLFLVLISPKLQATKTIDKQELTS